MIGRSGLMRATSVKPALVNASNVPGKTLRVLPRTDVSIGYASMAGAPLTLACSTAPAINDAMTPCRRTARRTKKHGSDHTATSSTGASSPLLVSHASSARGVRRHQPNATPVWSRARRPGAGPWTAARRNACLFRSRGRLWYSGPRIQYMHQQPLDSAAAPEEIRQDRPQISADRAYICDGHDDILQRRYGAAWVSQVRNRDRHIDGARCRQRSGWRRCGESERVGRSGRDL